MRLLPLVLVLSAAVATGVSPAASVPRCPTPVVAGLPAYTQGATRDISWTAGASGGFIANASADDTFAIIEQGYGSLAPATSSQTFVDLPEGPHYYQVKAKTSPNVCNASDWGNVVTSIQDATGPEATITDPEEGGVVVSPTGFTISGTLTDPMAGSAPGSGPKNVTITLQNTTPVAADVVGAPEPAEADASSGSYSHTFDDLMAGSYTATVVGTDNVGNVGSSVSVSFIVVSIAAA